MAATTSELTHRKVSVPTNWERRAFLFMRLSGVALLLLAVGHMLIQHVLNSSQNLTILFVAEQWGSWGWKVYDMGLLVFAIIHGFNGFRNVLEDYIHNRSVVKGINIFLLIFMIVTIFWAGYAIYQFNPQAAVSAVTN
jgi:succinate dehydrogenase / fumarate reductase membrane anchor subunit